MRRVTVVVTVSTRGSKQEQQVPDSSESGPAVQGASAPRRMTVPRFREAKGQQKLAMLTAYDEPMARLFDAAGVDAILVGDTLGMVVQGKSTTLPVTLDEIIYHAEIVARTAKWALVVVDLPFMSYQVSPEEALRSAGRVLKETGAAAVKLEGGAEQAATIRAIAEAGIPVMGHVGLRPQAVHSLGGMNRIQRDVERLKDDALAAQSAGAFSLVLELIPRDLAAEITSLLDIPTIGIGAGPECDGQVLVGPDMLGLTGFQPRFLKQYADLGKIVREAAAKYTAEVRDGAFPSAEHSHE